MATCSICGRYAEFAEEFCEGCKEGTTPGASQVAASNGVRNMLFGLLWFTGGALVTGVTFANASSKSDGGTFIVAWGAIVTGLIQFVVGFFQWLLHRKRED